jgi:hypothetical protein
VTLIDTAPVYGFGRSEEIVQGGRNDASMAEFRTRRPNHISEIPRYRAVSRI